MRRKNVIRAYTIKANNNNIKLGGPSKVCISLTKRKTAIHAVLLILITSFNVSHASNHCSSMAGRIVSIQGQVTIGEQTATANSEICPGSMIATAANSRAAVLVYNQNTILRLNQNTEYVIGEDENRNAVVEIFEGIIHIFSRVPQSLKVKTPYVNATIEGTELVVSVDKNKSDVIVFDGRVRVFNMLGELLLNSNEAASAAAGQAPVRRQIVDPISEVNWALHYPPIDVDPSGRSSMVQNASILLFAGQVDSAQSILQKQVNDQPDNTVALALLAMIAVTQNNNELALDLSNRAVESGRVAIAYIASSYANQAMLNLDQALDDAQNAFSINPQNVYALLRLAEMQSATGLSAESYENTKIAVELDSTVSRAHTLLGFNLLEQFELTKAIETFVKAVELDQSDPQPRLGLGLAMIRNNQLDKGIEQLEIAVSLSPNDSLIRSFLGNAYMDSNNHPDAADQFSLASQLDENDPTPYLYDALNLQEQNRPVEALKQINKSIELNNNRSVLRSKNLLDQDFASRVTRQGRIYRDLGFEQLALVEGWKALQIDPANHAGHRFLADVYGGLPRHQLARDSELLQAELLQPAIVNAVEPRLSSNGLSFLSDTSFVEFGANDHTRSFQSNGFNLKLDALGGSNSTYADNATVTGNLDRFSFSLGQFHYETDGIRVNNDEERDIYAGLAQYNLTADTSLHFEARKEKGDRGDTNVFFDPELASSDFREINDFTNYRFSFSHEFTNISRLVGTYLERRAEFDAIITDELSQKSAEDNQLFELRQFHDMDKINLTYGLGHVNNDLNFNLFTPAAVFFNTDTEIEHNNIYSYADFNHSDDFTFILGVSADQLKNKDTGNELEQINPKLGSIWNVSKKTTLRGAVFRTLKRTLSSGRTLERTNIAGFNQFFEDFNGVDAYRYGLGVDREINNDLFGGMEINYVDSKVTSGFLTETLMELDRRETGIRSYLAWTASKRLAINAEYFYDHSNMDEDLMFNQPSNPEETHTFSLESRYFNPGGWIGGIKASFIDQKALITQEDFSFKKDSDNFTVVDIYAGYRMKTLKNSIVLLEIRNLFDSDFKFQSTDPLNSNISRERAVFLKLKLEF